MLSEVEAPRSRTRRLSALSPRLLCVLGLTLCAISAAPNPLDDLKDCADKMRPEHAVRKLAEQCPNLDTTLDALGLSRLLDPQERERLNSDALRDLVALSAQYSAKRTAAGPRAASLSAIAEQVNGKKVAAALSWWDRLKTWFKEWFSQSGKSDKNWFDEWLRRVSDSTTLLNVILYTCMGLVIASALAVVFLEMRATGVLRRQGRAAHHLQGALAEGFSAAPLTDSRDGVPRLLGLLVARLISTGRLQYERTLTHRELVTRSIFDTAEQRRAFGHVSQAAEALVYGGLTEMAIPQPVIEQGNALLTQLTELSAPGST